MNKFKQNQTFYVKLQTKKFVNPIPIVYCVPEIIDRNTVVYIFNCGLGSTNAWNLYMNCPLFQRNYFVIYEKQGHGLNHNKPSQYLKKYIYELDVIIQWTKKFFPQYQIFLLGESWGGSINCLYYKKYHHLFSQNHIKGVFVWNIPNKPIDVSNKSLRQIIKIGWRLIFTLLFNFSFMDPSPTFIQDKLSQNALLIRAQRMAPLSRQNTRLLLAVWRSLKKSWSFLMKNINNGDIFYLQSGQDAMADWKKINKLKKIATIESFKFIPTGYHILSFEPNEATILYETIATFTKTRQKIFY